MLLIRNLKQGKIKFELPNHDTIVKKGIERLIDKFSYSFLKEIFSKNLKRKDFDILEANALYIEYVQNDKGGIIWHLIFLKEEGVGCIYLDNDKKWDSPYDFYSRVIEYELNKGRVVYAFALTADDLFPIRDEKITQLVAEYIAHEMVS